MDTGFLVYLEQLKRTKKRAQKQEVVAVRQAVSDAQAENKAALVQKY